MLEVLGVACIATRTYFRHQTQYLEPAILSAWAEEQATLIDELQDMDGGLIITCDGRCDTPGHSAKFGSYIDIEIRIRKIIDIQIVQVFFLSNSLNVHCLH